MQVLAAAAAVGKRQEESIVSPCTQEEGDGEVVTQIFGDGERCVTLRVLVPEASGHVLCKKVEKVNTMRQQNVSG